MGWTLSLFLIALVSAGTAAAYPTPVDFDGSLMRWNIGPSDAPITYEIDAAPQDAADWQMAIDDAADLWNNVPTSYFAFAPVVPGQKAQVTVKLESALTGVHESAGYAIFDEYAGKNPIHCDIHVQVDDGIGYTSMAKTFLHEMGHCLGLGHSLIPEAIMSYSLEKNSFALDIDDEAGAARLYPADGSKPKLPPGCAVGAATDGRGSSWPLRLLLLLLAPALAVASMRRIDPHTRRQR